MFNNVKLRISMYFYSTFSSLLNSAKTGLAKALGSALLLYCQGLFTEYAFLGYIRVILD